MHLNSRFFKRNPIGVKINCTSGSNTYNRFKSIHAYRQYVVQNQNYVSLNLYFIVHNNGIIMICL